MGSDDKCCLCNSSRMKDQDCKFYALPQNPPRRKQWLTAIGKMKSVKPNTRTKVCSRHFVNGRKLDIPGSPGYIPTIFTPTLQSQSLPSRPTVRLPLKDRLNMLTNDENAVWSTSDHDYVKTQEQQGISKEEAKENAMELKKLRAENVKLKKANLSIEKIKDSPKEISLLTGFPNYGTFKALFNYLKPKAARMRYWRGEATFGNEHYSSRCSSKPGKDRKLSLEDEFFAVMVRLRLGLFVFDIATRFVISPGTFSKIFSSWINLMYIELKAMFELPCRKVVVEGRARCFREFPDVVMTLDCTELFTEKPSDLDVRKQLYSQYKHNETVKFMVGISPCMAVTYVSACYGGRASDKFITGSSEDLLESLKAGDAVMADKGFTVEFELKELGVKLHVPDFKGAGRSQLTSSEIVRSNKISKARVHVERIIGKIKNFHILDRKLKLSMKNTIEQIFVVCAYLVNFHAPIIKDDDGEKK